MLTFGLEPIEKDRFRLRPQRSNLSVLSNAKPGEMNLMVHGKTLWKTEPNCLAIFNKSEAQNSYAYIQQTS